jgi:hypothetical protein
MKSKVNIGGSHSAGVRKDPPMGKTIKYISVLLFIILNFTPAIAANTSNNTRNKVTYFGWCFNKYPKRSDTCSKPLDTCTCNKILTAHAIWEDMDMRVEFDTFATHFFADKQWITAPQQCYWACSTAFHSGAGEDAKGRNIPWKSGATWNSTSKQNLKLLQDEHDLLAPCFDAENCKFSDSLYLLLEKNKSLFFLDSFTWKLKLTEFLNQYPVRKYRLWAKDSPQAALQNVVYEFFLWRNDVESKNKQDKKREQFVSVFSAFILQQNKEVGIKEMDYVLGRLLFLLEPNSFFNTPQLGLDTAVRNFIESISKARAQLNAAPSSFSPGSHCIYNSNWLIINPNKNRDIHQFYNGLLYSKPKNAAGLRFVHDLYEMPNLYAHIEDKNGYLCKFDLYYDSPQKWYNISRILYVDSIVPLYADTSLGEAYYHIWVQQDVAKKYWNSLDNLNKYFLVDGFVDTPIYCIAKIHMICRVRFIKQ